jgi:uncharacterized membrane protein YgcG
MEPTMTTDLIEIKLTRTNFLTRHHCHVCCGCTEKVAILAEGELVQPTGHSHGEGEDTFIIRVCERCLEEGQEKIDTKLELHARQLEAGAAQTRALIGRLRIPSYADWQAAEEADDARVEREYRAELEAKYRRDHEGKSPEDLAEALAGGKPWATNEREQPGGQRGGGFDDRGGNGGGGAGGGGGGMDDDISF